MHICAGLETSERLHIDFAKLGYRASNHCDYTSQMVTCLSQMECMPQFDAYLRWADPEGAGTEEAGENDRGEVEEEEGEGRGTMEDTVSDGQGMAEAQE